MAKLNVTPEDNLNARNSIDAVCYRLMEVEGIPFRAIESKNDYDEHDFRIEFFENSTWVYFARAESKARKYYRHPLVSVNKINAIWNQSIDDEVGVIVALWFEDTPDTVHWQFVTNEFLEWAEKHVKPFGHGKRLYREDGYPFPRENMKVCKVFAKRLKSINSDR